MRKSRVRVAALVRVWQIHLFFVQKRDGAMLIWINIAAGYLGQDGFLLFSLTV
jgi:hypothetical protein